MDVICISSRDELEQAADFFQEESNDRSIDMTLVQTADLDDDYSERLTEVLGSAGPIRYLRVTSQLLAVDNERVDSLWTAIGRLGGLEYFQVYKYRGRVESARVVKVKNISRIIGSSAEVITSIKFNCRGIDIDGSAADFAEFGALLSECKQLTKFEFMGNIASGKSTFATVNPLLNAINSLPHLVLQPYFPWQMECWIPHLCEVERCSAEMTLPLARVRGHPSVKNLYILDRSKLAAIARTTFYHNDALPASVYLRTDWSQADMRQLGEIVANSTSLVSLRLMNTRGNAKEDKEKYLPLVAALGGNVSLRVLRISGMMSPAFREMMTDMMEKKNFSITCLQDIIGEGGETRRDISERELQCLERIRLYETLNRQGRGQLFRKKPGEVTRDDWIWRLHRSRNNLSCLFYYLSMNPSLCDKCGDKGWPNHNEAPIATRTRKRRKISSD